MKTALIASVLAALLLCACGERDHKKELPRPSLQDGRIVFSAGSPQLASFVSAEVKARGPIRLRLPGRVIWDEEHTVRLYPAYGGRVVQILVKTGDRVAKGQPLAILASPDFGQTQAEARRAATDLALAEKSVLRLRELNANGVAASKDLHAAEADYARAASEHERATAKLKLYGGAANAVDQNLSIASPIAGVVVERNINPGQELRPDLQLSNAPPMFVITDPTRLWLQLDATERDLHEITARKEVLLRASAWPEDEFPARIDVISDFVDPSTRTVKVRGSLLNKERKLKGEMFVTAEFQGDATADVEVPAAAILLAGAKHYAFVEESPGRFRRIEVKTSGEHDGKVDVRAGLSAGQRVVIEGSLFLQRIHQQLTGAAAS